MQILGCPACGTARRCQIIIVPLACFSRYNSGFPATRTIQCPIPGGRANVSQAHGPDGVLRADSQLGDASVINVCRVDSLRVGGPRELATWWTGARYSARRDIFAQPLSLDYPPSLADRDGALSGMDRKGPDGGPLWAEQRRPTVACQSECLTTFTSLLVLDNVNHQNTCRPHDRKAEIRVNQHTGNRKVI